MIESPVKWIGGKKSIRKKLVSIMPEHTNYVEVFAGGLWVLLGKEPCKLEVFNDMNEDLINFYKVIQDEHKCNKLIDEVYFTLSSREIFDEYDRDKNASDLSDIEKAKRFYYILKLCFGGNIHRNKRSFATSMDGRKMINRDRFPELFLQLHERIKHCYIEKKDYSYILKKYDDVNTLFFCDPPYLDCTEDLYSSNFNENEYKSLHAILSGIKGKFILTVKNNQFVQDLFEDFHVYDNNVQWSIRNNVDHYQQTKELIITNYEIEVNQV